MCVATASALPKPNAVERLQFARRVVAHAADRVAARQLCALTDPERRRLDLTQTGRAVCRVQERPGLTRSARSQRPGYSLQAQPHGAQYEDGLGGAEGEGHPETRRLRQHVEARHPLLLPSVMVLAPFMTADVLQSRRKREPEPDAEPKERPKQIKSDQERSDTSDS